MEEEQIQFFKEAGINMNQYLNNIEFIHDCCLCRQSFNLDNYANLLNCNHFLCQECCFQKYKVKTCKFPGCKKQINIKKINFWPFEQKNKENENYYIFVIYAGYGATKGNYYKDISQNVTIKELIDIDYNVQQYLKLLLPQHQSVVIGAMSKLYEKIKHLKIKDLVAEARINKNATNKIIFQNKERGQM